MTRHLLRTNAVRLGMLAIVTLGTGCASGYAASAGTGALAPQYVDPRTNTAGASGIGFESQDIREMSDRMVRDLLAEGRFGNATVAPRVIIDDSRFLNESNQTVNINLLTDRLRIELMRAAQGRMVFVSRQNVDQVESEKALKQQGRIDDGAGNVTRAIAGADYKLVGRITSQSSTSNRNGVRTNYYQFSFEMLDLNNGISVWGNLYDLKKAGANDRIYN